MKKKQTEFLTEEEAQAILRVPDRRTIQGKWDSAITLTLLSTGYIQVDNPLAHRTSGCPVAELPVPMGGI